MVTPQSDAANIRIAVVDDERMLLNVFSSLMHQYGYHADFFSDPTKAIDVIINHPARYQLIILDIRMPQMDGLTFARRIRAVLPLLPIMFMTGEVSDDVKDEALKLDQVTFLEKPFPLEETLRDVIPRFLGLESRSRIT